jgi:hypothetical protein
MIFTMINISHFIILLIPDNLFVYLGVLTIFLILLKQKIKFIKYLILCFLKNIFYIYIII